MYSINIKTKFKKLIICFAAFSIYIALFSSCTKLDYSYKSQRLLGNLYVANESMFASGVADKIVVPNALEEQEVPNVGADGYFIASLDRYNASFSKYHNSYKKLPMASLTKLMTCLVVLENCKDLNEQYYVTQDAIDLDKDVSKCNLKSGDKVTVIDLLYGLMVPSGNDAAMVLAENLVDSYDNFIIMMNNEAERIGAINSHFANPHGLDSEYHYSTAYDLFLITRELTKYPIFKDLSMCKEYTAHILQSDGSMRDEKWENTNYFVTEELLMSGNVSLLGGKTGTTTNAGNCLVLYTKHKKTGYEYISVVLNAKSKRNSYYNSNALLSAITNEKK